MGLCSERTAPAATTFRGCGVPLQNVRLSISFDTSLTSTGRDALWAANPPRTMAVSTSRTFGQKSWRLGCTSHSEVT